MFIKRKIDLTFKLGIGDFGSGGFNTVKISDCRVEASIAVAGGMSMAEATVRVYGIPLDIMNKLSIVGQSPVQIEQQNLVIIEAGNSDQVATCFVGTIIESWVDASQAPDVSLIVQAKSAAADLALPATATSFKGPIDVALLLSGIAARMNPPLNLENSGVQVTLRNVNLPGDLLTQIQDVCRHANVDFVIENGITLAIWPKNGARNGTAKKISRETGMVGYPLHTQGGITLITEFDPTIAFGGLIDVESDLTPNNGIWKVYTLSHNISSETAGGPWFTQIDSIILDRPGATP